MHTLNQITSTSQGPAVPRAILNEQAVISLREVSRIALSALVANKMRSVLTALGVIIGVAAVIILLALGRGTQDQITERLTANGANLLTVVPGSLSAGGFGSSGSNQSLTAEDAEALADSANTPSVSLVSPQTTNFATISAGSRNTSGRVFGVTPAYMPIHNHTLSSGEFITESQVQSGASVAVLGSRVVSALFDTSDPVGQHVRVNGQRLRVIGVLASKGGDPFSSIDDSIVVPITTAQRKLFGTELTPSGETKISSVTIQARDQASLTSAEQEVATTLRVRHKLDASGVSDDFTINNQQALIDTLVESQRTLTLYLGAIASISLLVGGIGIMNIMLVSVYERTREIGLRKALGARERDILTQFLIEALFLSTGGGLIGIILGISITFAIDQFLQRPAVLSLESMLLSVGVSTAIGLFFGIEPARRAARLDPIAALRHE